MDDLGIDKIVGGIKIDGVNPYAEAEEESWNDVPLWISTGCVSLDYAIGGFKRGFKGGIPIGKAVEINGLESSGKSRAMMQHIIRETLAVGGAFFLCDSEHAHEVAQLRQIGADLTNFRFLERPRVTQSNDDEEEATSESEFNEEDAHPKSRAKKKAKKKRPQGGDLCLEEFFDVAELTITKFRAKVPASVPIVIGLDSLAAIETLAQQSTTDLSMKDRIDTSVVMADRFKGFISKVTQLDAAVVIVNQLRSKPGVLYGDPLYSYGGDSKNYIFSLRIRMEKGSQIKMSEDIGCTEGEYLPDDVAGMQLRGQIVKNKVAAPWRKFRVPYYFDFRGVWDEQCFAQLVFDRQKWRFSDSLEKRSKKGSGEGNTLFWKGEEIGKGEEGLTLALVEDPKLRMDMEEELFMEGGE